MTGRTLIVLAAALIVLALVAVWGQRGSAPQSAVDTRFLPELERTLDSVDRVRIVGAGNESLVTLERRPDSWVIAEKQGYPADIGKIRGALLALAEARIIEEKTSNPSYYDRLGVEPVESEQASGVELIAYAGDDVRAAVVIGAADSQNLQFVRASDAATSYLVDRQIEAPRDAADWVDPVILDVSSERISAVTIEHPDGEVVHIERADAAAADFTVADVPEGRELSYPGVANVIAGTLRDLRLDDVAAAGDLPDDVTQTTFVTFDGLIVTATSYTRDDQQWLRFAASAEAGDDDPADSAAGDDAEAERGVDAEAEAARINARVDGFEYQIPSYLFGQLTRRMDDLLRAPAEDSE